MVVFANMRLPAHGHTALTVTPILTPFITPFLTLTLTLTLTALTLTS